MGKCLESKLSFILELLGTKSEKIWVWKINNNEEVKLVRSNESVATRTIQCAKINNKNIETKGMGQTNK